MAKINGLEVKAVKGFLDHEGCQIYQGSLYLGDKRIGFWSQDYMFGPDNFDLDSKYSLIKLDNLVKKYNEDKREEIARRDGNKTYLEYDLELLLYDLMKLREKEKKCKQYVKKLGYEPVFVICEGKIGWIPKFLSKEKYGHMANEQIMESLAVKNFINEVKNQVSYKDEEPEVLIFKSMDDFDIGKHIELQDIVK